jgi:hypothetical protein
MPNQTTPESSSRAADFALEGLRIWVHGRQFPDATDNWDANWLNITARYQGRSAVVEVQGPELDTVSFLKFQRELIVMVDSMTGEATLESVEPSVKLTVRFSDGLGHVEARLERSADHLGEGHWFEFNGLDQSHLAGWIGQLKTVLDRYPVLQPEARGV